MANDQNDDMAPFPVIISRMAHEHRDVLETFVEETARARQASREYNEAAMLEETGVEGLQNGSPVTQDPIVSQERGPDTREIGEDMTEPKPEVESPKKQIALDERKTEHSNAEEETSVMKQEARSPRTQAVWVTEAVAACQANKKVCSQGSSARSKH